VTGKEVGYFRLPYEGDDEKSTQAATEGILRAQRYGYLVTSHDFDSDDWRYSAGELTGEMPLPPLTGQNVTVLLHDSGGAGREVTIDYVRKLIAHAKSQGYTFTTMPDVQPALADRVFDVKPTIWDKTTLNLVQLWFVWPSALLRALFVIAVTFVVVVGLGNCVLAVIRRRRHKGVVWPSATEAQTPVSVVLAGYNEEQIIGRTLRSVLASKYPLAEVIVVNDGSSDGTAEEVGEIAHRDSRVHLVEQANTGKAGAVIEEGSRSRRPARQHLRFTAAPRCGAHYSQDGRQAQPPDHAVSRLPVLAARAWRLGLRCPERRLLG
jgi:hypothetical protein